LCEGQVAGTIQFFMIKAGSAESVATRSDEEDDRAETFLSRGRTEQLN
jgi:hypothetical protein